MLVLGRFNLKLEIRRHGAWTCGTLWKSHLYLLLESQLIMYMLKSFLGILTQFLCIDSEIFLALSK